MTNTQLLALDEVTDRFRNAPGWAWMPGMLFTNYSGENGSYDERVLSTRLGAPTIPNQVLLVTDTGYIPDEEADRRAYELQETPDGCVDARDAKPVLSDPTTFSCLLWLGRQQLRKHQARQLQILRNAAPIRMTFCPSTGEHVTTYEPFLQHALDVVIAAGDHYAQALTEMARMSVGPMSNLDAPPDEHPDLSVYRHLLAVLEAG